jgi:hypothetical protein
VHFGATVAESIVTELHTHATGVVSPGHVTADYKTMVDTFNPYLRIMHLEGNAVKPETVAALVKHWVKRAWGHDLLTRPETNATLPWRVNSKDANYENRDGILPVTQAPLAHGQFPEYRPYGSIPGTFRLIEGTSSWWVTDNGTHGGTAACRAADWWVWPKATGTWHRWNVVGTRAINGAGTAGNVVPLHTRAALPPMTDEEIWVVKIMKGNTGSAWADRALFGSRSLWSDAQVMAA